MPKAKKEWWQGLSLPQLTRRMINRDLHLKVVMLHPLRGFNDKWRAYVLDESLAESTGSAQTIVGAVRDALERHHAK
jgi:hypothetical protein